MTEPLIQLKPCPFCGKKPTYSKAENMVWPECDCQMEGNAELETWNTRPVEEKLLDACKAAYAAILSDTHLFNQTDERYKKWSGLHSELIAAIYGYEGSDK